ncbi:hypothetical protein TS65_19280 [Aneurinibacillus migulanus]|uniref:Uncharacterized protein n=1 Tax=Aneurinibacillus migulanus TaxID=47500 RepID=A0A0D1W6P7_ANEMI|nr:hypothetical protein TS65_19280 [Aneurinibacillus migulanus]KON97639.1 hypothetical protein AF333_21520 [Aneurinibacillus migulanus]GED16915.1 hypothetical protein AMI01nite_49060 [Aneurinibacillus migulanus]SDJ36899.1 hypothetical protein SAMN04487909_11699 [Aneurinibacillus migulanus]
MNGQKMKDIAKGVRVSRTRAKELKLEVVKNLAWVIYDKRKGKGSLSENIFFESDNLVYVN